MLVFLFCVTTAAADYSYDYYHHDLRSNLEDEDELGGDDVSCRDIVDPVDDDMWRFAF